MIQQLSKDEREEAIEDLRNAQKQLYRVIEALKSVAQITNEHGFDRTIIASLEQAVDDEHEWIGHHDNIDGWIVRLENPDTDEDVCGECGSTLEIAGDDLCITCAAGYHARMEAEQVEHKRLSELEALEPDDKIKAIVRANSSIIHGIKALRKEYGLSLRGAKLTYERAAALVKG